MIVLMCGYAGSGRDTCARRLCSHHAFRSYRFSTETDDDKMMNDAVDSEMVETSEKIIPLDDTELLRYGTQRLIPQVDCDVRMVRLAKCIRYTRGGHNVVITNLVFGHELDFIRRTFSNEKIVVAKLIRSSIVLQTIKTHPTENEHNKIMFNYVIVNNSSVENLHQKVDRMMSLSEDSHVMYLLDDESDFRC